jgi:hypothetical protein
MDCENQSITDEARAPPSTNARSWKVFAALINDTWRKGAEAFIQTGRYIREASEELDRDEFEALLKLRLTFEASVGRKLKRIGENKVLCAHVHKLPPCWSTLYELTKLEDGALEAAIADGKVHPKMMRKDAIALRKPKEADAAEAVPVEPTVQPGEFVELWGAATDAEKIAVWKHEGADGILKLLKNDKDLLADLYERVLGLQVMLAAPVASSKAATNLLTNLTGTRHWALGQDDPASGAQGLKIIKAKLAVNKRDPQDICFAFTKKKRR